MVIYPSIILSTVNIAIKLVLLKLLATKFWPIGAHISPQFFFIGDLINSELLLIGNAGALMA